MAAGHTSGYEPKLDEGEAWDENDGTRIPLCHENFQRRCITGILLRCTDLSHSHFRRDMFNKAGVLGVLLD